PTRVAWTKSFDQDPACDDEHLELLVPHYEGVLITHPAKSLPEANMRWLEIGYPGVLAIPMIAYRCGAGEWTAVYTSLDTLGASLRVRAEGVKTSLELECPGACTFHRAHAATWQELARAVARAYDVRSTTVPLASRYKGHHFYVHQWVSAEGEPLRTDQPMDTLVAGLKHEDPSTIAYVYGIDPNGIDLRGEYFTEPGAVDKVKRLVAANPRISLFSWLNLRSYKYAVPPRGIDLPMTDDVHAMARLRKDGSVPGVEQFNFKSWEMCIASEAWEKSRWRELEKLVALGFKVIALDEFPIPSSEWRAIGCSAKNHLHKPDDFPDEARIVRAFVERMARYAHDHGVLISEEEPSAAYLPFISGYVDRISNPPDMYEGYAKTKGATVVPLFSTMFGQLATPYTDPNAKTPALPGWLPNVKVEGK
ncbi:MAG: hypothetical protein ABIP39_08765, partial [Polyangiaceae bacterium]